MATECDPYDVLLADYRAAAAQERSEWKLLNDGTIGAVERVKAYARWSAAAERIRTLSVKMRNSTTGLPTPPNARG